MKLDWSITLTILGIIVSIAVGWITYYLSERRRRQRSQEALSRLKQTAKSSVYHAISRILGEDNVPSAEVLKATIRSISRELGYDGDIVLVTDSEVLDDLLRNITTDPFLGGDRRKRLLEDLQVLQKDALRPSAPTNLRVQVVDPSPRMKLNSLLQGMAGFLAAGITFAIFMGKSGGTIGVLKTVGGFFGIFILLLTLFLVLISFFAKRLVKKHLGLDTLDFNWNVEIKKASSAFPEGSNTVTDKKSNIQSTSAVEKTETIPENIK